MLAKGACWAPILSFRSSRSGVKVQGHTYLNEVPGDADAADLLTHTLRICFISSSQRRYLYSKVQTHTASIILERLPRMPTEFDSQHCLHSSCLTAKSKSVCLMLSEAKQTGNSEFGAEKGLFIARAKSKENGKLIFKGSNSPTLYLKTTFEIQGIWLSSDWRWWGNRAVPQESCTHYGITILHLFGGLSSGRRTLNVYQIAKYIPWRGTMTLALLLYYSFWLLFLCSFISSLP